MEIPEGVRLEAAARFGVNPEAMQCLGGMDGVVYASQRERQNIVLKVVPIGTEGQESTLAHLRAREDFVRYLAEHAVPVARPLPSLSGQMLELYTEGGMLYALTAAERAPGHHVQARFMNEWNETLWRRWGQVMGRMHALTRQYEAECGRLLQADWRQEVDGFIAWCDDDGVKAQWRTMRATLEALPTPPEAFGLIHNDLHPQNFLVEGDHLTVIDFGVSNYHWFTTDIAIAVFHALWMRLPTRYESPEAFALRFLRAFMAGYDLEYTLPSEWLLRLPLFIDYRRLLTHTVFSHEWANQPAPWQTRVLQEWRRGILAGRPTVALEPLDLLSL